MSYKLILGDCLEKMAGLPDGSVACVKTGRKFIGIERDPGYFQIAKKRIEEAKNDPI